MNQQIHDAGMSVEAQFKFSADELIHGMNAHLRCSGINRYVPYLGGVMICVFFFICYSQDLMTALPLALIGIFFLSFNLLIRFGFRRRFRANPHKDTATTWMFSADKISSEGEGFNHSLAWSKVYKFIDSPRGFLIYPQKGLFYWIPFGAFRNDSGIQFVREIAKSQVKSYKLVN